MHLDGISGRGFSGPLPDHRFNDVKMKTTIYCHHTLGMTARLNCNCHVVNHIDALRDENVQVFSGFFTF